MTTSTAGTYADAQADVGDLQDQERLAETREREQRGHEHEPPKARAERAEQGARSGGGHASRRASSRGGSRTNSTSTVTDASAGIAASQNTVRNESAVAAISAIASSGPANAPTVSSVCRRPNAAPRTSAGVELGDQRVARRAANALADAIDAARREHPAGRRRQREQRLRDRGEPVAQDRQQLAFAEPVAERAREHLRDRGDGLGRALEQADGRRRWPRARSTKNTGNSAWIISDEMSMNRLTKPSAQTPRGMANARAGRAVRTTCRRGLHRCGPRR